MSPGDRDVDPRPAWQSARRAGLQLRARSACAQQSAPRATRERDLAVDDLARRDVDGQSCDDRPANPHDETLATAPGARPADDAPHAHLEPATGEQP